MTIRIYKHNNKNTLTYKIKQKFTKQPYIKRKKKEPEEHEGI